MDETQTAFTQPQVTTTPPHRINGSRPVIPRSHSPLRPSNTSPASTNSYRSNGGAPMQSNRFVSKRQNGATNNQPVHRPNILPSKTAPNSIVPRSTAVMTQQRSNGSAFQHTAQPAASAPSVSVPGQAGRASFNNSARAATTLPPNSRPMINMAPSWAGHREAKFCVLNLPPSWTTLSIHRELKRYGNITYIDIPEQMKTDRMRAFVAFSPVPRPQDYGIFRDGLELKSSNGARKLITFEWRPPRSPRTFKSPVDARVTFPEEIAVRARHLDFGVMKSQTAMMGLFSIKDTPVEPVEIAVNTMHKCLEFNFLIPTSLMTGRSESESGVKHEAYKLRINFSQITKITEWEHSGAGGCSLVLSVEAPPMVYRKTNAIDQTHFAGVERWTEWQSWLRQTGIEADLKSARKAPAQVRKDSALVEMGRWLTYRLDFCNKTASGRDFRQWRDIIEAHSVSISKGEAIEMEYAANRNMWSWLDNPSAVLDHAGDAFSLSALEQLAQGTVQLPFDVRYQLESCVSHGLLHECNMTQDFINKLSMMVSQDEHGRLRVIKVLEKVVDEGKRYYKPDDIFRHIVPNMRGALKQRHQTAHYVKIRSATVTPTTIYFNAPTLEQSNRVIRRYRHYEDRFLRVKYIDEKYKGKLFSTGDNQQDEVYTRVKRTMTNGIRVGDRLYEFLAYGNSQFREHGAYFFASTADLTAQDIREQMGNFDHIKVVAKYSSRLGQCFSTTRATQNTSFTIVKIPDVERNGYCFSDGVGTISPLLAQLISNEFNLLRLNTDGSKHSGYPSAFQFRLAGCKGILVVDPKMSGLSIGIRPSQEKFPAMQHTGLEICRISQSSISTLNVQIILVLSALGVKDEVFMTMMSSMLSGLERAMTDENKAVELLQKNIDFIQITVQLAQLVLGGFMEKKDPFVISCLHLWRSWSLKYLKEKARIFVEQGAFVLGCIDETSMLEGHSKENSIPEIFLQVPDFDEKDEQGKQKEGKYKVIEGICILARNPSLHPGDIRVVRAVRCKELEHIRDCVVLPQKGDRDIANMCSGGDLDGDDYLVMWDKELIPSEQNHEPMDFKGLEPKKTDKKISAEDMANFFVTHMKYDNVAPIACAHRYHADREPEGVKSDECLELARLHSIAVDYSKSGQEAILPKNLRIKKWPHWAEKNPDKSYQSNRIIGRLYDMVKRVDFVPAWDLPFDQRILGAYELSEEILQQAKEVKEQYDEAVRRIMAKYNIKSEFEVWTTFVLGHSDDYGDYKFAEKLGEDFKALKDHHEKLCFQQVSTKEDNANKEVERDWSKMGPFIAAMYTVTAQEVKAARAECNKKKVVGGIEVPVMEKTLETMPFMSFPWLFPAGLTQIATKKASASMPMHVPMPAKTKQNLKKRQQELLGDVEAPPPLPEITTSQGVIKGGDLLDLFPHNDNVVVDAAMAQPASGNVEPTDNLVEPVMFGTVLEEFKHESLPPPGPAKFSAAMSVPTVDQATNTPVDEQEESADEEPEEVFMYMSGENRAFDALEALVGS